MKYTEALIEHSCLCINCSENQSIFSPTPYIVPMKTHAHAYTMSTLHNIHVASRFCIECVLF